MSEPAPRRTEHSTTECLNPDCPVETPHGHDCPICGPGIFLFTEVDD